MFNKLKNLIIIICILTAGLTAVNFALAQGADNLLFGGTQNEVGNAIGLGSEDPRIIIAKIIRVFIGFLGIIALGLIVYAGFLWMTSEGNEEMISKAKKVLQNAVIGLAIILVSFGIVTFLLNKLLGATGIGGIGGGSDPPTAGAGLGALGSCTVESVYPEPNQEEVPRNTSIIVTFKEEVDINTICNDISGDGNCLGSEYIIPENVRIYKTGIGDACGSLCDGNVLEVNVSTNDNKTFVFTPVNYLGSPSEYIWYTVYLTNGIEKSDQSGLDDGIFSTCSADYLEWQFEVSNKIDLTPPQVKGGGVFPAPDNEQDEAGIVSDAVQAEGDITVVSQPEIYVAAAIVSVTPGGGSPSASAAADEHNSEEGVLTVTVLSDGLTAQLSKGAALLGSAVFSGSSVTFSDYFTLTVDGGSYDAGNFWDVDITAEQKADTLTVGGITYVFGEDIELGATTNGTAFNIAAVVGGNPDIFGVGAGGGVVTLTAAVAGSAGNNIILSTSNPDALDITAMSGGKDREETTTINGREDKPRNSVIQINFNEAVNPITTSGNADDVWQYIRIVNNAAGSGGAGAACVQDNECLSFDCDGVCVNDYLAGEFIVSNQYKTVEFVSDDLCGVNGCGENIYCLPETSNLKIELVAANLDACAGSGDCAAKSPYITCGVNFVCQNDSGENYPLSEQPFDGIMDAALNSLDGNRDGDADGPINFYDENNPDSADGDNFQWSFYINDVIDLTPPEISSIEPEHNNSSVSLSDPVEIYFNKLMMSGSLRTGSKTITNGNGDDVKHKIINIWNFTNRPVGYWITKENLDDSWPLDGQPDYTLARINHSMFSDATSYRSQVGSGVKDIYQNCYKPSAGPGCAATDAFPSCCAEALTAGSECP